VVVEKGYAAAFRLSNWTRTPMKIAGVQMDIALKDEPAQSRTMIDRLRETTPAGRVSLSFLNAPLCGYCFDSLEEARPFAESIPGPPPNGSRALVPSWAATPSSPVGIDGPRIYNAPSGGATGSDRSYRKVHLPYLGIDMFTTMAPAVRCPHAGELKVGMNICYDASFPEPPVRCDSVPTYRPSHNWLPGPMTPQRHQCRALENAVYYIAVNRVGTERGSISSGGARLPIPSGETLAEAQGHGEEILYARSTDPTRARHIRVPGKHEIDRLPTAGPRCTACCPAAWLTSRRPSSQSLRSLGVTADGDGASGLAFSGGLFDAHQPFAIVSILPRHSGWSVPSPRDARDDPEDNSIWPAVVTSSRWWHKRAGPQK